MIQNLSSKTDIMNKIRRVQISENMHKLYQILGISASAEYDFDTW